MIQPTVLETGKIYYTPQDNPFVPVWLAKILDIRRGHSGMNYVAYETYQCGAGDMSGIRRSTSEDDFRACFKELYQEGK